MRLFLLSLTCVICLITPALAETACDFSGDSWEDSSTRLTVNLEIDGHPRTLHFASLYFMFRYFNEAQATGMQLGEISQFSMLDYGSIGGSTEKYLSGNGQTRPAGWFLWTNRELPGSSYPYIAAFTDQARAQDAMRNWGGEILDAEEMLIDLYGFFAGRHGLLEEGAQQSANPAAHSTDDHGGH